MNKEPLTDDELTEIERLSELGSAPPWESSVEGRDHTSGDSFIRAHSNGEPVDIYVTCDGRPASEQDLDLIAAARSCLPRLVAEIRRIRSKEQSDEF